MARRTIRNNGNTRARKKKARRDAVQDDIDVLATKEEEASKNGVALWLSLPEDIFAAVCALARSDISDIEVHRASR